MSGDRDFGRYADRPAAPSDVRPHADASRWLSLTLRECTPTLLNDAELLRVTVASAARRAFDAVPRVFVDVDVDAVHVVALVPSGFATLFVYPTERKALLDICSRDVGHELSQLTETVERVLRPVAVERSAASVPRGTFEHGACAGCADPIAAERPIGPPFVQCRACGRFDPDVVPIARPGDRR